MKRGYMRIWAEDLGVGALVSAGQPAILLAEGRHNDVRAYIDRVTKMIHWGPTPARMVSSSCVADGDGEPLPIGLMQVSEKFPIAVSPGGTYNGRDCIDFSMLAGCLGKAGHAAAARELEALVSTAFAHVEGRVKEADDGSGWVGYASPEPQLARPALDAKASTRRRYGRVKEGGGSTPNAPNDLHTAADSDYIEHPQEPG